MEMATTSVISEEKHRAGNDSIVIEVESGVNSPGTGPDSIPTGDMSPSGLTTVTYFGISIVKKQVWEVGSARSGSDLSSEKRVERIS